MANWTGIAYKIPRTALDKCKDLDILKQSGVYFLFGTDKSDNAVVYIGQAGVRKNGKGLLLRVQEIHNSIDYLDRGGHVHYDEQLLRSDRDKLS